MKLVALATALALLPVAIPQEPAADVEELLKRVEEGTSAARDAAERGLIRLGPAVVPEVRKRMSASSREAWVSLDRVLGRIESDERRRRFRAAASPVSLKIDNTPFPEVLPELERILGMPLGKHDALKLPVTVDLKDVCAVEALDRACASAKTVWYAQRRIGSPDIVPQVVFRGISEPLAEGFAKYVKGYRVAVGEMTIQRRRTPFSDESSAWVGGVIQPSPNLGHVIMDEIRIGRVVDDLGAVLHEAQPPKEAPRRPQRLAGAASPLGHIPWHLTVKPPAREARTFSVMGGVARIRGEVERRHVALEAAESALGRSIEFEGLTLTLESISKVDGKLSIGVVQKGRRTPTEGVEGQVVVEGRRLEYAELRLRDGSTLVAERVNRPWGPDGRIEHVFNTKAEPAEIRFITYTVWESEELPFEFRDVLIPGGGR